MDRLAGSPKGAGEMEEIIVFLETASLQELEQLLLLLNDSSKVSPLKEKISQMITTKKKLVSFVSDSSDQIP